MGTKTASPHDLTHTLMACANDAGQILIWVWTLGGVDRKGKEIDPEPERRAYPSHARAADAAKRLGPKVWPVQALFPLGRGIRWAK